MRGCQILMDKPNKTYCPGEVVSGNLIYILQSSKNICGICVKLYGKGRIRFPGISEKGREEYVKLKYFVIGKKFGYGIKLHPGRYAYPFSFTLPLNLPTSFEGRAGSIRYTIRIVRYEHWTFHNDKKTVITIISPVDLNLNPQTRNPFTLQLHKNFTWICVGGSGSIVLNVHIPITGYIPGQVISISAECLNLSSVHINSIKFKALAIINYHLIINPVKRIKSRLRPDILTINQLNLGPTAPNSSKRWIRNLEILPIHTCNWDLSSSKLFDLIYELMVEVQIPFPHTNLIGKIPILIGAIPHNLVNDHAT